MSTAARPPRLQLRNALSDLERGFGLRATWLALARMDIRARYRGSALGPFWLTLNTFFFVVAVGLLFSRVTGSTRDAYIPYLAVGYVLWQFISALISEGCICFHQAQATILQVPLPFSVYAYRMVVRNVFVLAHTALVVAGVLIFYHVDLHWNAAIAAPALGLLCLNGLWIALLLGMLSLRFHDVPPTVASLLQFAFFLTPVFWQIDSAGSLRPYAAMNPLFAALDVVRAPLLGMAPQPHSWTIFLGTTAAGFVVTLLAFARFRQRIPYWL